MGLDGEGVIGLFSVAALFTCGTALTVLGKVRNPGIRDFNLSLFKNITMQFGRPGSTVGHTSFEVISAVGVNPRSVQLVLKSLP
jgi:hypothetical protein